MKGVVRLHPGMVTWRPPAATRPPTRNRLLGAAMVVRPGSEHVAAPGLTRRRFLGTLGSAAAAGLLTACGGSSGGGAKSGSTTLSFIYLGTAEQQASWNKLFAKF